MKKRVFAFLVLFCTCMLFAEEVNLAKDDVTSLQLQAMLFPEYTNSEIDEDGDLRIIQDGIVMYVIVDSKRSLIKFLSEWAAGDSISDNRAHKLMNSWNTNTIFATAYYAKNRFALEYYLPYEGGVSKTNFNASLKYLIQLSKGFGKHLAEEDAL